MKQKNTDKHNLFKLTAIIFTLIIIIGGIGSNAFGFGLSNDNFATAEPLNGIQVHILRTNMGATKEPGEQNHAGNVGGKSVWFKWTAPMSRSMTFSTNRSMGLDTLLAVYTGTSLNSLGLQCSNDD